MRKLLLSGFSLSLLVINACSVCEPKVVEESKGQERGMLTEDKAESNTPKRGFKAKHGVSSLIQKRLQEK